MTEFNCDNKYIEKALRNLYKLVVDNGGILHEKLTISSINGELQINASDEIRSGEEIITLSEECLLPVDKFKLNLDGFKIVMLSHDKDLSEGRVAMMIAMIELFNLTGKIETHIHTSTFSLYYEDTNFLDKILKSRSKSGIPFLEKIEKLSKESFYLESYLYSRTLGVKETGKIGNKQYIMPFIEFLNHHITATGYTPRHTEVNSTRVELNNELTPITVMKSCPIEGSNECYVRYGSFDAMDMLINYNYSDTNTFFVRSIPIRVGLPGDNGTIDICSKTSSKQHKDLPDKLKNIEFYIPEITINIIKDIVNLDFIYIPAPDAPNAMRRVLALSLAQLELDLEQSQMIDLLRFVEQRIISENIKYYEDLSGYLDTYKPKPAIKQITKNIRDVVTTQLNNIKNYELMK